MRASFLMDLGPQKTLLHVGWTFREGWDRLANPWILHDLLGKNDAMIVVTNGRWTSSVGMSALIPRAAYFLSHLSSPKLGVDYARTRWFATLSCVFAWLFAYVVVSSWVWSLGPRLFAADESSCGFFGLVHEWMFNVRDWYQHHAPLRWIIIAHQIHVSPSSPINPLLILVLFHVWRFNVCWSLHRSPDIPFFPLLPMFVVTSLVRQTGLETSLAAEILPRFPTRAACSWCAVRRTADQKSPKRNRLRPPNAGASRLVSKFLW